MISRLFSRAVWPGAATKDSAIQAAAWQPRGDQLTDGFEEEDVLSEVGDGMKLRCASAPLARQPSGPSGRLARFICGSRSNRPGMLPEPNRLLVMSLLLV